MNKKFVVLFLIAILVISMNCSVYADSVSSTDIILIQKGYSIDLVNSLSDDNKEYLLNTNSVYVTDLLIEYYEPTFSSINLERGQISSSKLTLQIVLSYTGNQNGYNYYSVVADYTWSDVPAYRNQDPISVSWDQNIFEIVDDSFSKTDYADGYISWGDGIITEVNNAILSHETNYAQGFTYGVTWYADIRTKGIIASSVYGNAQFQLRQISTTTSDHAIFFIHYVHNKLLCSTSINVGQFGNITISGGSNYDEMGNQRTFYFDDLLNN